MGEVLKFPRPQILSAPAPVSSLLPLASLPCCQSVGYWGSLPRLLSPTGSVQGVEGVSSFPEHGRAKIVRHGFPFPALGVECLCSALPLASFRNAGAVPEQRSVAAAGKNEGTPMKSET